MDDSWTIVYTTVYPQDIYPAKNLLESAGMTTFVRDELTAQVNNFYSNAIGGVKLLVHPDEAERALALLVEGGYIDPAGTVKAAPVVVDTPDRGHCPYCGSGSIFKKKELDIAVLVFYLLLSVLLPIFKRTYHCWDCGRDWKFGRKKQHSR